MRLKAPRHKRGFTLVEVGISLLIMSLLMLGASDLFLTAARNTTSTTARVQTTQDAANGLQYILNNGRVATSYAVPGDTAWVAPRGATASYQSGTVNTGIQFSYDNRATTTPTLCVTNCTSGTTRVGIYDPTQPTAGQTIWIYRADADGTPDPTAGMYLHATIRPAGMTSSVSDTNITLARLIETTRTDAVSFIKLDTKDFQAEVVSSTYAGPNTWTATDESDSSLNAAPLTCKSVRLRN
jgi:prepilin-type N-terminal cleavage/methylation domain-containing protein